MKRQIALIALSLLQAAVYADSRPATKEEVQDIASLLPRLDSSSGMPFIVRGIMPSIENAYAYEVICREGQYRAAMLDPEDDLPLVISDLVHIYVMDLYGGRAYSKRSARFAMLIQSDAKGLKTGHLWSLLRDEDKLPHTTIDISDAVRAAAAGSQIEFFDDGAVRLTQPVGNERVRIVQVAPPPSKNFEFGQIDLKEQRYTSFHQVLLDSDDIDAADPMMPKGEAFKFWMPFEVEAPRTVEEGRFQMAGELGKVRRGLRGDEASRDLFDDLSLDWNALAKVNREMEAQWREALQKQGLEFAGPERPWIQQAEPSTRPTDARG